MNRFGTRRPRSFATMRVGARTAWHAVAKERIARLRESRGSQAMMAARWNPATRSARAIAKAGA